MEIMNAGAAPESSKDGACRESETRSEMRSMPSTTVDDTRGSVPSGRAAAETVGGRSEVAEHASMTPQGNGNGNSSSSVAEGRISRGGESRDMSAVRESQPGQAEGDFVELVLPLISSPPLGNDLTSFGLSSPPSSSAAAEDWSNSIPKGAFGHTKKDESLEGPDDCGYNRRASKAQFDVDQAVLDHSCGNDAAYGNFTDAGQESMGFGGWGPSSPRGRDGCSMRMLSAEEFLPPCVGPAHSILPQSSLPPDSLPGLESGFGYLTSQYPYSSLTGYSSLNLLSPYGGYSNHTAYADQGPYGSSGLVFDSSFTPSSNSRPLGDSDEDEYDEGQEETRARHAKALMEKAAVARGRATAAASDAEAKATTAVAATVRAKLAVARAFGVTRPNGVTMLPSIPFASHVVEAPVSPVVMHADGEDNEEASEEEEGLSSDDNEGKPAGRAGKARALHAEWSPESLSTVAGEAESCDWQIPGPFPFPIPRSGRARSQKRAILGSASSRLTSTQTSVVPPDSPSLAGEVLEPFPGVQTAVEETSFAGGGTQPLNSAAEGSSSDVNLNSQTLSTDADDVKTDALLPSTIETELAAVVREQTGKSDCKAAVALSDGKAGGNGLGNRGPGDFSSELQRCVKTTDDSLLGTGSANGPIQPANVSAIGSSKETASPVVIVDNPNQAALRACETQQSVEVTASRSFSSLHAAIHDQEGPSVSGILVAELPKKQEGETSLPEYHQQLMVKDPCDEEEVGPGYDRQKAAVKSVTGNPVEILQVAHLPSSEPLVGTNADPALGTYNHNSLLPPAGQIPEPISQTIHPGQPKSTPPETVVGSGVDASPSPDEGAISLTQREGAVPQHLSAENRCIDLPQVEETAGLLSPLVGREESRPKQEQEGAVVEVSGSRALATASAALRGRPWGSSAAAAGLDMPLEGRKEQLGPRQRKRPRHLLDEEDEEVLFKGKMASKRSRVPSMGGKGAHSEPVIEWFSGGWGEVKARSPIVRRPGRPPVIAGEMVESGCQQMVAGETGEGTGAIVRQEGSSEGHTVKCIVTTEKGSQVETDMEIMQGDTQSDLVVTSCKDPESVSGICLESDIEMRIREGANNSCTDNNNKEGQTLELMETVIAPHERVGDFEDEHGDQVKDTPQRSVNEAIVFAMPDTRSIVAAATGKSESIKGKGGEDIPSCGESICEDKTRRSSHEGFLHLPEHVKGTAAIEVGEEFRSAEVDSGKVEQLEETVDIEQNSLASLVEKGMNMDKEQVDGGFDCHKVAETKMTDRTPSSLPCVHESELVTIESDKKKERREAEEQPEGEQGLRALKRAACRYEQQNEMNQQERALDIREGDEEETENQEQGIDLREKEDGTSDLEQAGDRDIPVVLEGTDRLKDERSGILKKEARRNSEEGVSQDGNGIVLNEGDVLPRGDEERLGPGEVVSEGKSTRSPSSRRRKRPRQLLEEGVDVVRESRSRKNARSAEGDSKTPTRLSSDGKVADSVVKGTRPNTARPPSEGGGVTQARCAYQTRPGRRRTFCLLPANLGSKFCGQHESASCRQLGKTALGQNGKKKVAVELPEQAKSSSVPSAQRCGTAADGSQEEGRVTRGESARRKLLGGDRNLEADAAELSQERSLRNSGQGWRGKIGADSARRSTSKAMNRRLTSVRKGRTSDVKEESPKSAEKKRRKKGTLKVATAVAKSAKRMRKPESLS